MEAVNVGDLMITTYREPRPGKAAPALYRTIARVIEVHRDIGFVVAQPLRLRCWIESYFDLGRDLPPSRAPVGYALEEVSPLFTDTVPRFDAAALLATEAATAA